jgi:hypothetical protein
MKNEQIASTVWIVTTVVLTVGSLLIVFASGLYLNARAEFSRSVPGFLPGLYLALKENGALVAGLSGFSMLSWVLWQRRPR